MIAGNPHAGHDIPPVVATVFAIRNGKLHKVNSIAPGGIFPDLPPPPPGSAMPPGTVDGGKTGLFALGGHGGQGGTGSKKKKSSK